MSKIPICHIIIIIIIIIITSSKYEQYHLAGRAVIGRRQEEVQAILHLLRFLSAHYLRIWILLLIIITIMVIVTIIVLITIIVVNLLRFFPAHFVLYCLYRHHFHHLFLYSHIQHQNHHTCLKYMYVSMLFLLA